MTEGAKVRTKKDLGIDGVHSKLGNELNMPEFKGFMTSEMGNMKDYIKEMKEELKEEIKDTRTEVKSDIEKMDKAYTKILFGENGINERIIGVENLKTQIFTIVTVGTFVVCLVANRIFEFIGLK